MRVSRIKREGVENYKETSWRDIFDKSENNPIESKESDPMGYVLRLSLHLVLLKFRRQFLVGRFLPVSCHNPSDGYRCLGPGVMWDSSKSSVC